MDIEQTMKLNELRRYIEENYITRQGKYVTRADLVDKYTDYVTYGQKHPQRALSQGQFTKLMNVICDEKGLLYKKCSGRENIRRRKRKPRKVCLLGNYNQRCNSSRGEVETRTEDKRKSIQC